MSLFQCDGCLEEIQAHKARIECQVCCPDYSACANCYVVGNYTKEHREDHATVLKVRSGTVPRAPPLPQRPQLPPRPATIPQTQRPETFTRTSDPAPSPNEPPGRGWSPLLTGSKPTSTLLAFLDIVFSCLDTQRTGLLTPEQYSAFCDVQGYLLEHDPWKKFVKPHFSSSPTDQADYELRRLYENFSIDHELRNRAGSGNQRTSSISGIDFSAMFGNMGQSTPMSRGMMPMLTRRGFIDITVLEIAGSPSIGWQRMNRAARHYNIWRSWGDIPRDVLPDFAPQDVTDMIKRIHASSQAQADNELRNLQVEMERRAEGRRHAEEITDPYGRIYVQERR